MKTYGLPYTGSKDKIADKICSLFPIKENFYDLFGGGGSITHYQLLQNNYKHYIYNEYNPLVAKTFQMAINGEFKNEIRWISHEDFNKLKDTDPYVACCFSFGNDFQSYAYGKDVEPYKKALHYAIVFQDYKLMNDLFPDVDFTFLDKINNVSDRRLKLQNFMKKNSVGKNTPIESSVSNMEISQNNNHLESLNSISDFRIENLERFEKVNNLNINRTEIEHLERFEKVNNLNINRTEIEHLERYNKLQSLKRLEIFNKSYDEIEIKPNSIIYLDPPYKSTKKYASSKDFDYEKFYDWCGKQTELCFISEYEMPSNRFTCIAEIEHRSTICATENQSVIERVFLPNHYVGDYYKPNNPKVTVNGRFPANTILTYDDSDFDEVCGGFPNNDKPNGSYNKNHDMNNKIYGKYNTVKPFDSYGDSGSASRYFYCAKATKRDRNEGLDDFEERFQVNAEFRPNHMEKALEGDSGKPYGRYTPVKNFHPTVKPTSLMQYLVRLVTPKGGTVLDPFNGSGSTGKACMYENADRNADYKYIGIELTEEYLPISKARIEFAEKNPIMDYDIKKTKTETNKIDDEKSESIFDLI